MKRLICLFTGHRYSSWSLRSRRRGLRIVDDYSERTCSCCHSTERVELTPRWKL